MNKNQKSINDLEWWENLYDEPGFSGNYFRQRKDLALSWIYEMRFSENAIIFDAGCGGGRLMDDAARKGYQSVGMDFSWKMLEKSRVRCRKESDYKVCFIQGDVEVLAIKDTCLDAIICLGVISYLKSEKAVLAEFSRALKPGGLLILSGTNKARLIRRLDIPIMILNLKRKIYAKKSWKSVDDSSSKDDQQRSYLIPQVLNTLKNEEFTIAEYVTFPYDLPTFMGHEYLPRRVSEKVSSFVEHFDQLPVVGSFGSMWMIKANKNLT